MKRLDLVALGGLVICAITMGTGLLIGNGTLQFVGSFFGWFLAAYSSLRYVIQAVRLGLRTEVSLWGTVVPVNFALALIGVAVFGIHDWDAAKLAMAVFAGAMIVGFVLARVSIAHSRYAPLGLLLSTT